MSDTSQGEGWWQASDAKWYPPESHPDYRPPPPAAAPPPPSAPAPQSFTPLAEFKAMVEGKNATVKIWPDRIEYSKPRSAISRRSDDEMIPMRNVSAVTSKKAGIGRTLVSVITSGHTIEFRVLNDQATAMKSIIQGQMLA